MKHAYLIALLPAFVASPVLAAKVGRVGAVNQSAHGSPPGKGKHALTVGGDIEQQERIETSGDGNAQIIFNDSSTMVVGRNSEIVVDDFVYSGGRGSQSMSMTKGVLRFVGGGVSHVSGARLNTTAATIGIRGGTMLVGVGGDSACQTLAINLYGSMEVVGRDGGSQSVNRSGYGVCAQGDGTLSEPVKIPQEKIHALMRETQSHGKQTGGVQRPPRNKEADESFREALTPEFGAQPGLDAVGAFWAGNATVQSGSNAVNQAHAAQSGEIIEAISQSSHETPPLTHIPTTPGLPPPPGGITPTPGVPGTPPPLTHIPTTPGLPPPPGGITPTPGVPGVPPPTNALFQ
jgi:hypothetical protein